MAILNELSGRVSPNIKLSCAAVQNLSKLPLGANRLASFLVAREIRQI